MGFEPDPGSITIACTGGPTLLVGLPALWSAYRRVLIVGPERAALFKTNVTRDGPTRMVWSGSTTDLRVRKAVGWILRGDLPGGLHFFVDAKSEGRRLSTFLGSRS